MNELEITLNIQRNWLGSILEKMEILSKQSIKITINESSHNIKIHATNIAFIGKAELCKTAPVNFFRYDPVQDLKSKLQKAEEEQRFEDAARLRDEINLLLKKS